MVLVARTLGPHGYGAYVAALATASFFTPLACFGSPAVVLRDGSRAPDALPGLLATAARTWRRGALMFGILAAITVALVLRKRLGQSVALYTAVGAMVMAEVASNSVSELLAREAQALRRFHRYGAVQFGQVALRLLALLVFLLLPAHPLAQWIALYASAGAVYVLLSARLLKTGPSVEGAPSPPPALRLLREGVPFAIGALTFRLQLEFNKPVLAALGFATVGVFGAAQRVVDLASIPLVAMQEALWPRLFGGRARALQVAGACALIALLALAGGVALLALAPLLPRLLGQQFQPAVRVLQLLAWLPLVQFARNFANAMLIAAGRASRLTPVFVSSALFSVCATVYLVGRSGLNGAILALYATEGFMVALLTLAYAAGRSRR